MRFLGPRLFAPPKGWKVGRLANGSVHMALQVCQKVVEPVTLCLVTRSTAPRRYPDLAHLRDRTPAWLQGSQTIYRLQRVHMTQVFVFSVADASIPGRLQYQADSLECGSYLKNITHDTSFRQVPLGTSALKPLGFRKYHVVDDLIEKFPATPICRSKHGIARASHHWVWS